MKSGSHEIEVRTASRTLLRVLGEPVTWAPFLPIAAAYSFLDAPWAACTVAACVVAASLAAWWRSRWPALRDANRVEVLREMCRDDNAQLQSSLTPLLERIDPAAFGETAEERSAILRKLQSFLRKKETIDDAIFADDSVSPIEAEISSMISELCRAMLADLKKLAEPKLPKAERRRLAAAVASAVRAMERTHGEIETLLEPAHGLGQTFAASTAEDRATRLEERLAEARAIRSRLQRDMTSTDAVPESPRLHQS